MNLLGVCEALILGQKQGVDPNIVAQVINGGAASSWAMQNLAPKINAGDFAPGFMIDTQQKDMRLVMEAAEKAGVPVLGAALAQQLWRAAQVQGHGSDGIQAMFKVLAQMANLEDSELQ
jgi:3-hydroxyisobutyrate dehydrogenase